MPLASFFSLVLEMKRGLSCGRCGQIGHNRRTCNFVGDSSATAERTSSQQTSSSQHTSSHQTSFQQTSFQQTSSQQDQVMDIGAAYAKIINNLSKCPICFDDPMMPPLMTICHDNRHVICNSCFQKMNNDQDNRPPKCPQCRAHFPFPIRNSMRPFSSLAPVLCPLLPTVL